MIKKTILINTIALGLIGNLFSTQVFAEDSATKETNMTVTGPLGEHTGPTDPENPETSEVPEEEWIKVVLPTAVVFNSTEDQKKIESSDQYEIINESDMPVTVRINDYTITGGGSVKALTTLTMNRGDRGEGKYKSFSLFDGYYNGGTVGTNPVNRDFVTLANKDGKLVNGSDGDPATNFYFTGQMDKRYVNAEDPTVDSYINFKFTALN